MITQKVKKRNLKSTRGDQPHKSSQTSPKKTKSRSGVEPKVPTKERKDLRDETVKVSTKKRRDRRSNSLGISKKKKRDRKGGSPAGAQVDSEKQTESDQQTSGSLQINDKSITALAAMKRKNAGKNSGEKDVQIDKKKSGVIYVGRIPHGFYEKQMRSYFSQFGKVLRLKISRNRKTGASRHFGFVEFEYDEQAKIAAETMNDYLLSGHILKCKFTPEEEIPENAFSARRLNFTMKSFDLNYERKFNKPKSSKSIRKRIEGLVTKENRKRKILKRSGIDYDFPGYTSAAKNFLDELPNVGERKIKRGEGIV